MFNLDDHIAASGVWPFDFWLLAALAMLSDPGPGKRYVSAKRLVAALPELGRLDDRDAPESRPEALSQRLDLEWTYRHRLDGLCEHGFVEATGILFRLTQTARSLLNHLEQSQPTEQYRPATRAADLAVASLRTLRHPSHRAEAASQLHPEYHRANALARRLRESRGLTLKDVGDYLNVKGMTVAAFESGDQVGGGSNRLTRGLADVLGCHKDDLIPFPVRRWPNPWLAQGLGLPAPPTGVPKQAPLRQEAGSES